MTGARATWLCLVLCVLLGGCRSPAPVEAIATPPDPDTAESLPTVARAIARLRANVIAEPTSAGAWGRLGMLFQSHAMTAEAGACYERAQRLDPREFRWPYLAATAGRGFLDPERVLGLLLRAHEINPIYPALNIRLGEQYLDRGRADEAGRYFEHALAAAPTDPHALLGSGRVALAARDLERSRALLERALWEDHEFREAWVVLVRVHEAAGRDDLARRAAAHAEGLTSNQPMADPVFESVFWESALPADIHRRANRFVRRGQFDDALALFDELLAADPEDVEARIGRARALER